jgi:hypothetical protein
MRVIVIGAGLGGLTLAHGLRRAGIDVVVYERDGARGRPQGVSLHVDDRGASALRACLPPEHVAMAEATMGGPRDQTLTLSEVDGEFAVVGTQPSDGIAGRARPGRQAHRPLLRAVLLTGLEDVVRFGAEFTRFEQRADGRVLAWFAGGDTDTADVLVGADGIGSAVRRRYLPHVRVVDTGKRMLMGATPLRAVTGLPDLIGDSPASARVRGTMMALGVLRFTESPVTARRRWLPALHPSAVAEVENYVMWALPSTRERLGSAMVWRHAKELTADLPSTLRLVVNEAWPDITAALRIGMIPPMPAWPGDGHRRRDTFGARLRRQPGDAGCASPVRGADRGTSRPARPARRDRLLREHDAPRQFHHTRRGESMSLLTQKSLSLFTAMGGWRTVAEGVASRALFLVAYLLSDQVLTSALVAVSGVFVFAVVRMCTDRKFWQPAISLAVVGLSALLAGSTGHAVNFYLTAVLIQAAGTVVFLASMLARWPVIGLVMGTLRGERLTWQRDRRQRRRYQICTAIFLVKFGIATAVLVPLYLAGQVTALGIAATLLGGAPAAGICLYLCWRILRTRPIPVRQTTSSNSTP